MQRKVQKNTNKKISYIRIVITTFFSVIFFVCILLYFIFQIQNVEVVGSNYYSAEQIENYIIKETWDKNTILLYLKHNYLEEIQIPYIDEVEIKITSRNSVQIEVYEKVMIGCIEYMNEYLYFDKDGTIVESSSEKLKNIPFIVGLKYDRILLHQKLEIQNDELYPLLLNLTKLIQKYKLNIDKIVVDSNGEIILVSGKIKIYLGKREMYDEQVAELTNLLPKIEDRTEGKSFKLDMRNFEEGQDRFILKEQKK